MIIIGISNEDDSTVRGFYEKNGINYAVAADVSGLPSPYNEISAIPTTFFIDRNGVIQTIVEGYENLSTLRSLAVTEDYAGEVLTEPRPVESIFVD